MSKDSPTCAPLEQRVLGKQSKGWPLTHIVACLRELAKHEALCYYACIELKQYLSLYFIS